VNDAVRQGQTSMSYARFEPMVSAFKLSRSYASERAAAGTGYSSYTFLTSALDGDEWPASRPGCALPSGKEPLVHIGHEAGWASAGLDIEVRGKVLYLFR
jgi:hypothetical protein